MTKKIIYIGSRDIKEDNIAATGLVWARGEVHEVADEKKAAQLLAHPDVWADAEKEYTLRPAALEPTAPVASVPSIQVVPQGGAKLDVHWEPVIFTVPAETFEKVRDKELDLVFMSPEDAEQFKAWKSERVARAAQAQRMRDAKATKNAQGAGLEKQSA